MRLLKTLFAGLLSLGLLASPAYSVGTIFGLPLSQQVDNNGQPLSGALLYLYEAGTTTPVTAYEDFSLSTELPWPIEADSNGRLPEFWLEDGDYRARLTNSGGVPQFDVQNVTALGPSSGEGGGEGEGISENAVFTTGMMTWIPQAGTKTGWVRANGRTIGSLASGASERANADTQSLYEFLWNNFSNSIAPVTGGRGSTAAEDFAANKPIATLDMRDKMQAGLSDMGNTDTTGLGTTAGASGGAETVTLTTTELPAHTHGAGSYSAATHTHSFSDTTSSDSHSHSYTSPDTPGGNFSGGGGTSVVRDRGSSSTGSDNHSHTVSGTTGASGALAVSGTSGSSGSGTAFSIMNPYRLGSFYMKL